MLLKIWQAEKSSIFRIYFTGHRFNKRSAKMKQQKEREREKKTGLNMEELEKDREIVESRGGAGERERERKKRKSCNNPQPFSNRCGILSLHKKIYFAFSLAPARRFVKILRSLNTDVSRSLFFFISLSFSHSWLFFLLHSLYD